jgi:glycosyltransferase involved in cell wall biosynthesis
MNSKKIRLMQITHDLAIGGLQQVVVNLCRTIDRDVFDVSVLCLRELGAFAPELESLGIKVHFIPQEQGTDYLSFLKVAKVLKENRIDVIHTHNTQPFVDGTIGALMSGVKTIVHTDHARDFPDKMRYMLAEWAVSHFAYKVVGVSDHTSRNLMRYEKISPKKIQTIMNGIAGDKFKITIDREKKRRELNIRETGPVIGLGVRIAEQKGITYLLQAMPAVIQMFPDISLVIAGTGELEDSLKREARDLGIDKNVFFVGPRLDMPELLKLFDAYVLPSLWEGLPMVLLEAMAAGCPIIATDVGGNYMAVTHRVNGSLVEPKNPQKLAAEICTLLNDEKLRIQYAETGREIFANRFSAEIMTRQYEKLYLRIL